MTRSSRYVYVPVGTPDTTVHYGAQVCPVVSMVPTQSYDMWVARTTTQQ